VFDFLIFFNSRNQPKTSSVRANGPILSVFFPVTRNKPAPVFDGGFRFWHVLDFFFLVFYSPSGNSFLLIGGTNEEKTLE
jgi:hypothetical protein